MLKARNKSGRLPCMTVYFLLMVLLLSSMMITGSAQGTEFIPANSLNASRMMHTATLLPNGKVLVAGGASNDYEPALSSAELFDPATGKWTYAASLATARRQHTATLLPNGKVLVTGGVGSNWSSLFSAELYDPTFDAWSQAPQLPIAPYGHTATLLRSGSVLIFSGHTNYSVIYEPLNNSWAQTGNTVKVRRGHTATLLADGRILVTGGYDLTPNSPYGVSSTSEVFDPYTNSWAPAKSMVFARAHHTATLLASGKVLVQGGVGSNLNYVDTTEVYDPATDNWSTAGALDYGMILSTATLLPDGKILVAGGAPYSCTLPAERALFYIPETNDWSPAADTTTFNGARHTATLLPGGRVLLAGRGDTTNGFISDASVALFDPIIGSGMPVEPMDIARGEHTASILPDGKVLITGGRNSGGYTSSSLLHDPSTKGWSTAATPGVPRIAHATTLLTDGTVLVTGGYGGNGHLSSTEYYNVATSAWATGGSLAVPRGSHTSTLLADGRVLVTGGVNGTSHLASAEIYTPSSRTWSAVTSMSTPRRNHTATMLRNGKVLVVGGSNDNGEISSAEMYDPATGIWTPAGSLAVARRDHRTTLMVDGRVLVSGGFNEGGATSSTELYDPAANTWSVAAPLATARAHHSAVLLPTGMVAVLGGFDGTNPLSTVELYDPGNNKWRTAGMLASARSTHSATLLPSGKILLAGGHGGTSGYLSSAELFALDTGFPDSRRPVVENVSFSISPSKLAISGHGFRGDTEGTSGTTSGSNTDFPLVRLQRVDNDQSLFLYSAPGYLWSNSFFMSESLSALHLPFGHYRAIVYVNAIPSMARLVRIAPALAASPTTLDFGDVMAGSVSDVRSVLLSNTGSIDLALTEIQLAGQDAATFKLAEGGTCSGSLAPGESCLVNVTYAPELTADASATLRITSNDPDKGIYEIPLSGNGVATTYAMTITLAGSGTGSITVAPPPALSCSTTCCQSFAEGTIVTLTPIASADSVFAGWEQCETVTGSTCALTMNTNKGVTGNFLLFNDFPTLQEAYDQASDNGVIKAFSKTYIENLQINRPITVDLQGGYTDATYSNTLGYTSLQGELVITSGTLVVSHLAITSADISPPSSITSVSISDATPTSVSISWITEAPANSRIDYGETNSYGAAVTDSALTSSHRIALPGLKPGTTYHFRASSTTTDGILLSSGDKTFTTPLFETTTVGDFGNVTVMEIAGSYDSIKPDGTISEVPRQEISREFIRLHGDIYDFLVIFTTFPFAMPNTEAGGFYIGAKNDTQGIGEPIFDNTALFGSNGKLQGTVDLGNIGNVVNDPLDTTFEATLNVLSHEIAHRWGPHVAFRNADGTVSHALLDEEARHWSYLLDSSASLMYGNAWRENGDGTFTSTGAWSGFSPLDLYLMGLYDRTEVPPLLLIDNPAIDPGLSSHAGDTVTGTPRTVTIDDIIAAEGERIPAASQAQKEFRVGFVLLTKPDVSAGNALAKIEAIRAAWAGRFAALTGGRAGILDIPPSLTLTIAAPASGTTIVGPTVTVEGAVVNSTGNETGITVNGIAATVTGNRFVANDVPLGEGENIVTVSAIDTGGLTATTSAAVTSAPGHYIDLSASIESGLAPLEVDLSISASFGINDSILSYTGPVPVELLPGATPTSYTARLPAEGTYTLTADTIGPDGLVHKDTVTVVVLSKLQIDRLLQNKWQTLLSGFANNDQFTAIETILTASKNYYQTMFDALGAQLSSIASTAREFNLISIIGNQGQYELVTEQNEGLYSYDVIFTRDVNGLWKIQGF